jgi:hypothetical protein
MDRFKIVKSCRRPKMRRQFHLKNKMASRGRRTRTICFSEKLVRLFCLKKKWSRCFSDKATMRINWIQIWVQLIQIRPTNLNLQLTDHILIWAIYPSKWTWLGVVTLLNHWTQKKTQWTLTRGFECSRLKKKEGISMKLTFPQSSQVSENPFKNSLNRSQKTLTITRACSIKNKEA